MTRHYPDLGGAFDWLKQISLTTQPIRNTTQIWVMTRHQYGISALVSQTSFRGETGGGIANRLSRIKKKLNTIKTDMTLNWPASIPESKSEIS